MFLRSSLYNKTGKILIVLISAIILLSGCAAAKNHAPTAAQGKLDLNHWDFQRDGIIKLDGEWELYPGVLLEPKDFGGSTQNKAVELFEVPNSYKKTAGNQPLPKYGFGTLRLVIQGLPDQEGLYGIITQQILSASRIWINGQLVSHAGKVSRDAVGAVGSYERQTVFFDHDKGRAEIVIQMSNFNNVTGKVRSMTLGNNIQIKRAYITSVATDIFIIGALFIMCIYHLALYYKRTQNRAPLYFAVFCLFVALRNMLVGNRLVFELFPDIPFSLFNKMAYLTVYSAFPFIVMFFKELFPRELSSKMVYAMNIFSLILSGATLFTGIEVYHSFLIYFEVWIVGYFAYALFVIIRAIKNKVQGAPIILFGVVVFVVAAINDMLLQAGLLYTRSLAPLGFFIFIFSQSYMLAAQFSDAYGKIEKLVEENKAVYEDELTGILNRRGFYEQGENLLKVACLTGGRFTLFYGDLNKLKSINDSFGHKEGDEAIKSAADLLKESFAKDDIVARMSGDEFVAIAMNKASVEAAEEIMGVIHTSFEKYSRDAQKEYQLSISLGYSIYNQHVNRTLDELINEADTMLYHNKSKLSLHAVQNQIS